MPKRIIPMLGLVTSSALLVTPVEAQFGGGAYPTADQIAEADSYQPPKLDTYAAKLASQPDMTGSWMVMLPPGGDFTFDPEHSHMGTPPVLGEAVFGPTAGTYIKDIPYTPE